MNYVRIPHLFLDPLHARFTLYQQAANRSLLACVWDERMWRYELTTRSQDDLFYRKWEIIESAEGQAAGYGGRDGLVLDDCQIRRSQRKRHGSWLWHLAPVGEHTPVREAGGA